MSFKDFSISKLCTTKLNRNKKSSGLNFITVINSQVMLLSICL